MEEQKGVAVGITIPPLHKGKCFVCYRDVNKAIEKHREMFGLRLALKRAVKLENYCLTVDQMKDLNLRLKYGELDYHCFAATGRPGRPGNDERCPLLVRLKLSPDAQSLIVYESHNHEVIPPNEGVQKIFQPLKQKLDVLSFPEKTCLKGDITLTPINSIQKNPVLILPKPVIAPEDQPCTTSNFIINNNVGFASLIPITQTTPFSLTSPISEVNSITITPTPSTIPLYSQVGQRDVATPMESENHEKITVRIKKSQVDPSEMVVVGSVRDTEERLKSKSGEGTSVIHPKVADSQPVSNPKESFPKPLSQATKEGSPLRIPKPLITNASTKLGNSSKIVTNIGSSKNTNPKLTPKSNSSGASPVPSYKPAGSSKPKLKGPHETSPTLSKSVSPSPSPPVKTSGQSQKHSNKAINIPVKPTVLKQSADMKQIIIKKSPQSGTNKPQQGANTSKVQQTGRKSPQIGASKSTSLNKSGMIKSNNPSQLPREKSTTNGPNQVRKVVNKPIQNSKITNSKPSGEASKGMISEMGGRTGDKIKIKSNSHSNSGEKFAFKSNHSNTGAKQNNGVTSSSYNNSNGNNNRLLNIPKKLKRKPGRPPESSLNLNSYPGSLDTELGFGEKQQLAHGVLLQLLRVTSQLPMVEFSHALDTLEVLTDAFRLSQRVTLSISRDQEDLTHNDSYNDSLLDRHFKAEDSRESSLVSSTTSDDNYQALANAQVDGQLDVNELLKGLSSLNSSLPVREDYQDLEMMDVELRIEEPLDVVIEDERSNVDHRVSNEHRRGLKRSSEYLAMGGNEMKRAKR